MSSNENKLLHDLNNYLYGQKAMTEMCLELLNKNELTELKMALTQLQNQQEEKVEILMKALKKALN